jgi:allantoin racemase
MRMLVANPNSTSAITEACVDLARQAASPGTDIAGWTNGGAPPVVDSVYADYLAGAALVRGLVAVHPVPDVVILAGFGNYGTAAVKEALDVAVVSMAEAAMALAGLLYHRFAIVTTSPRMVPYTEDLVRLAGCEGRCAAVRAVSLPPVGEPAPGGDSVVVELVRETARAETELGVDLVILGGARLSPYAAELRRRVRLPVLEPVACAVQLGEGLVHLGLRQSKTGRFAPPVTLRV